MKISDNDIKKELPDEQAARKVEVHEGIEGSSQTFNGIGLIDVNPADGNLILRGRHGERDHVVPVERALKWYVDAGKMSDAMFRNGVRGWDTLLELRSEIKGKLLDSIKIRRKNNIPVPAWLIELERRHEHGDAEQDGFAGSKR